LAEDDTNVRAVTSIDAASYNCYNETYLQVVGVNRTQ
jgi:hypothetical protein